MPNPPSFKRADTQKSTSQRRSKAARPGPGGTPSPPETVVDNAWNFHASPSPWGGQAGLPPSFHPPGYSASRSGTLTGATGPCSFLFTIQATSSILYTGTLGGDATPAPGTLYRIKQARLARLLLAKPSEKGGGHECRPDGFCDSGIFCFNQPGSRPLGSPLLAVACRICGAQHAAGGVQ